MIYNFLIVIEIEHSGFVIDQSCILTKPNLIFIVFSCLEFLSLLYLGLNVSPPVKYFTDRSKAVLLLWSICVIYVLCLLYFRACLFIAALWSPAGKGLISWLLFVMFNCAFVLLPSGVVLDCIDS